MKAIGLLSGGLDSRLAVRIILDQVIEVEVLRFTSPFCRCDRSNRCHSTEVAKNFNIPINILIKKIDSLEIIKKPTYGYGSGINRCIDCRIDVLKKAKECADSAGVRFIFSGEVLGQRPVSQYRRALGIMGREVGLEGRLPENLP